MEEGSGRGGEKETGREVARKGGGGGGGGGKS